MIYLPKDQLEVVCRCFRTAFDTAADQYTAFDVLCAVEAASHGLNIPKSFLAEMLDDYIFTYPSEKNALTFEAWQVN